MNFSKTIIGKSPRIKIITTQRSNAENLGNGATAK
jgi:hypothetical protein